MKNKQLLTPADIRQANTFNTLKCIAKHKVITVQSLANHCQTTIVTLGKIVNDLQDENLIVSVKNETAQKGRHGLAYCLNAKYGYFLCFDLTFKNKLFVQVYNFSFKEIFNITKTVECDDYISCFSALIEQVLLKLNGKKVIGVGVSTSGIYKEETDTILTDLFEWYNNFKVKQFINSKIACKNIIIGQDVTYAALAEGENLISGKEESLYYLYIGDGVGGAFINNNTPHEGADKIAGDIGQTLLIDNGKMSSLESYSTVSALTEKSNVLQNIKLIPLYSAIYNITWLLNPNYLVISCSNGALAQTIVDGAYNFLKANNHTNIKISTKFVKCSIENAALMGFAQALANNIFKGERQ